MRPACHCLFVLFLASFFCAQSSIGSSLILLWVAAQETLCTIPSTGA
jgi:hypothetical protein